jgi:predicted enzyme related to lactoylglutathione lyase
MLRKIDCVMIKVADLDRAVAFYRDVFGLRPLWRDDESVGLVFPDSDAEIVLHSIAAIPAQIDVNYLVDDVAEAVRVFEAKGCRTLAGPFPIAIGKCAVIRDPFGAALTLVDMTAGPRAENFTP